MVGLRFDAKTRTPFRGSDQRKVGTQLSDIITVSSEFPHRSGERQTVDESPKESIDVESQYCLHVLQLDAFKCGILLLPNLLLGLLLGMILCSFSNSSYLHTFIY